MKKYLLLLVLTSLLLCGCFAKSEEIPLPKAEDVTEVHIQELAISYSPIVDDPEEIEKLLKFLSTGNKTPKESVNDAPQQRWTMISFIGEEEIRVYFYEEMGKKYLELPYQGIWETDKDVSSYLKDMLERTLP